MVDFREQIPQDHGEIQRILMESFQTTIWTALPSIITLFNDKSITVECIPTVQGMITSQDGSRSFKTMPKLVDVPVCFPRGGGYTLSFPIVPGDECLVIFSSRCIDSWFASGGYAPPTDHRMHDLSDGFAIVGPFSQKTKISNISTTTAQLRSDDGTVFVELDKTGGIARVKAPVQVIIDAPVTTFTGVVNIQNSANASTASQVNGALRATGDIIAGTVSTEHHVHSSSGGSGTGGPPVP